MKKVLALLILALALVMVVAACGGDNNNDDASPAPAPAPAPDSGNNNNNDNDGPELDPNFPSEDITVIVPYNPGGTTDTTGRITAQKLGEVLGVNIIIENVPGGSSTIGVGQAVNADPDGLTIGITTNTALNIAPHTMDLPFQWDEAEPIARLVSIPQMLMVRADSQYDTFDEFLEYGRENPQMLQYSITGTGTTGHLGMIRGLSEADVQMTAVPYNGGAPAMQALLGGHVDGTITFPGNADADLTKILVDFSDERSRIFDAPTLRELGIDAGVTAWVGVITSAGTPEEYVKVLEEAYEEVMQDPEVMEALENAKLDIVYQNREDFTEEIRKGHQELGETLESLGMAR